jgi:RNA polymerase sigma-70 factor (ECF subfamily)
VKQGDFERLYELHAAPLLAFLTYRLGDPTAAEDVLADTFERVLRSRARFDPRRGSVKAWIYSIALNRARDHARRVAVRRRERHELVGPDPPPDESIDAVADRDELNRALEALSDVERGTVALRYGADLTVREIARVTGQRRKTVEGRLYRGLEKMRTEMLRAEEGALPATRTPRSG